MIDLVNQIKNQNLIYRTERKTIIVRGKIQSDNIYQDIVDDLNQKDLIYSFPNPSPIEIFIDREPFLVYKNSINSLFKKIVSLTKEACLEFDLNYEKNKYYISSNIFENQNTDVWYDAAGSCKPALFGMICLENLNNKISINEKEILVSDGDILISEAGNKIYYHNAFKSLFFCILPLSLINNQSSQKWIPLI